jgi:hypothetical protein
MLLVVFKRRNFKTPLIKKIDHVLHTFSLFFRRFFGWLVVLDWAQGLAA